MLIRKITAFAYILVSVAVLSTAADAKSTKNDQAPPPPAVPVPKVDEVPLVPPGPKSLEGLATAVNGDRINLGDYTVRLYGVAAPAIRTEQGPAARLALDSLLDGQRVKCAILGKTPDGDQLGHCSAGDSDLAKALLDQGLAAVYRDGDPSDTAAADLATGYDAAEAQARDKGLGIWRKAAAASATQAGASEPFINRAGIAYILALIAVLSIPITMVSVGRSNSSQRDKWRQARRYTMASGLVAEAEIVRAVARQILAQVAELPKERPIPAAVAPMLTLPSAMFWSANAERLELLPADVTVPLLRFYALHEETVRKLALAMTIPQTVVTNALRALESAAERAIEAIETSMGIKREKPVEPVEAPSAPATPSAALAASPAPAAASASATATPTATQTADSAPLPR